jgi:acetyltransferase-like isoleucine patch superfamily enzyme
MGRIAFRLRERLRVGLARLRVHRLRLLGARAIHGKCLIGARSRLDRAWRIELGARCVLDEDVRLAVVEEAGAIRLGEHVFLGRGVQIEASRCVSLGRGVLVGPGVYITDHNHGIVAGQPMFEQPCTASPVEIGDDVWIGAGCVILPGTRIGKGAVVAAGAVVRGEVPENCVVGGVPAKAIGKREAG